MSDGADEIGWGFRLPFDAIAVDRLLRDECSGDGGGFGGDGQVAGAIGLVDVMHAVKLSDCEEQLVQENTASQSNGGVWTKPVCAQRQGRLIWKSTMARGGGRARGYESKNAFGGGDGLMTIVYVVVGAQTRLNHNANCVRRTWFGRSN